MGRATTLRTLLLAALVGVAGSCAPGEDVAFRSNGSRSLAQGREAAREWIARGRSSARLSDEDVLALAYLERLRLGLGSPFRVIDQALRDPRLEDATRRRLALALLARTYDRDAYTLDPLTLRLVNPEAPAATGREHLELIESTLREARDPRAAELAVRLAYALAAAEGSVARAAPAVITQLTALLRDRELARDDTRRLLLTADQLGADPLALLPVWRQERRFEAEQPRIMPLALDAEAEAIELAPRIARAVRELRTRQPSMEPVAPVGRGRPLLSEVTALRLGALTDSLDPPPQTPVHMAAYVLSGRLNRMGPVGERFMERARDEERFAAEHALLHGQHDARLLAARLALTAAVGLRAYAQEEVWFPGFAAPSDAELMSRFGLASITYDADMPRAWRAYYRRMLAGSLTDLQRVVPSLNVRGLRLRIGAVERRAETLALHNPRSRTAYLPPLTGAGTIAHEIAHDLDWQVALRRYRVRGDYATDRATRLGGDRLAASVRSLSDGSLRPPWPGSRERAEHAKRPAEVFARGVDWFVAVALAREGRLNGYLTSVQDGVLTGYGTVTPPDLTGRSGSALVSILDEIAPLPPESRRWYLEHQGMGRTLSAYDLVRTVLEAAVPVDEQLILDAGADVPADHIVAVDSARSVMRPATPATRAATPSFDALAVARDAALAAIDAWVCGVPGAAYDRDLQSARRALVSQAAVARARGIALNRAREIGGEAGTRWVAREFFGEPAPSAAIDSATAALLSDLIEQTQSMRENGAAPVRFQLAAKPTWCAAGPLARPLRPAAFAAEPQ
ncbi:MAG: hypothetical protein ACRELD_02490 [Longimicrobiales bacterium]